MRFLFLTEIAILGGKKRFPVTGEKSDFWFWRETIFSILTENAIFMFRRENDIFFCFCRKWNIRFYIYNTFFYLAGKNEFYGFDRKTSFSGFVGENRLYQFLWKNEIFGFWREKILWRENVILGFGGKIQFIGFVGNEIFRFWRENVIFGFGEKISFRFFFAEIFNYLVLVKTIFSDYGEKMRFLGFNGKEISSFGGKSVCLFFFVSAEKWDFSVLTWKLNFFSFDGKTIILLCAKNEIFQFWQKKQIFSFDRKMRFSVLTENEIFGFDRKQDIRFWHKIRFLVLTIKTLFQFWWKNDIFPSWRERKFINFWWEMFLL